MTNPPPPTPDKPSFGPAKIFALFFAASLVLLGLRLVAIFNGYNAVRANALRIEQQDAQRHQPAAAPQSAGQNAQTKANP